MTADETGAGVGRLARKHTEVKRRIARAEESLSESSGKIEELATCFQTGLRDNYAEIQRAYREIDWNAFVEVVDLLKALSEERARLETLLREAGVEIR